MATRKMPQDAPLDDPPITPFQGNDEEEVVLSSSSEGKPKTGRELYEALVASGFIGGWKDRTDIGDSVAYARMLRENAGKRRRSRIRTYVPE